MKSLVKAFNLRCSGCGASLEISPDMKRFSCGYCGSEQLVVRKGGTVSLRLINESIAKVQVGTDKTAAELAIRRLREDLSELEGKRQKVGEHEPTAQWVGGSVAIALVASPFLFAGYLFSSTIWLYAALFLILAGVVFISATSSATKKFDVEYLIKKLELQKQLDKQAAIVSDLNPDPETESESELGIASFDAEHVPTEAAVEWLTPEQRKIMEMYNINADGEYFYILGQRYVELDDAISYARVHSSKS